MSSSGQAPNVSMDDLLASIKSMIEGESNGGANSPNSSQGDGEMGVPGAAPMNDAVHGIAMDDGIMDLTQVVRPNNSQQNQQHSLQGQHAQHVPEQPAQPQHQGMGQAGDAGGMSLGGTAQDAAAELNNLFNGFGNDSTASAQNMMGGGGDIGLPADGGADFGAAASESMDDHGFDCMMCEVNAAEFGALKDNSSSEGAVDHMDQMSRDGLFGGAMSGQQINGQNADGQAGMMPAHNPAPAPVQDQHNQGQLNQAPGNQGLGNRGIAGPAPAPHSPAPAPQNAPLGGGFGDLASNLPGNQGGMVPQQGGMGQNPNMKNAAAFGQGGAQPMVGQQMPAAGQAPHGHGQLPQGQGPQGQNSQGQNPQGQVPQQGHAMGQMPNQGHLSAQNPGQPQNYQPMAQSGQQGGGEAIGGHDPRLESELAMGQALSQADASLNLSAMHPQNQMLAQQQEQMRQMQHQHLPVASNGDGLPVLSGFRPVLPAVQEEPYVQNSGLGSSDQLPVEMRNNLEEIVKQLLKPLLREWLERNLPELLKGAVDEESGKIDPNRW